MALSPTNRTADKISIGPGRLTVQPDLSLQGHPEVMAIGAAIDAGIEEDFYISDLWDIFKTIFLRSKAVARSGDRATTWDRATTRVTRTAGATGGSANHRQTIMD